MEGLLSTGPTPSSLLYVWSLCQQVEFPIISRALISHINDGVTVGILIQYMSEERASRGQDNFMCRQGMLIFQYKGNITKCRQRIQNCSHMSKKKKMLIWKMHALIQVGNELFIYACHMI